MLHKSRFVPTKISTKTHPNMDSAAVIAATAAAAAAALIEAHKDLYHFTLQHHQGIVARLALEKKVHPHTVSTFEYNMSMDGTWPSIAPDSAGYSVGKLLEWGNYWIKKHVMLYYRYFYNI
jgi:hypothetical protein